MPFNLTRGYRRIIKRPITRSRLYDDGSSEYLSHANAVLAGVPITLAAHFRSNDATVLQTVLAIGDTAGTANFFALTVMGNVGGDPIYARTRATAEAQAVSTIGYTTNTWHHGCAVFAAANDRRIYLDGGNKGINNTNLTPVSLDNTSVGALIVSGAFWEFSGDIAVPAIWNAALTDSDVRQLAHGALPWHVRPQSLLACWDEFGRNMVNNRFQMLPVNSPGFAPGPPKLRNVWMMPLGNAPAAPIGAIMNQIQFSNLGADLYNGALI